MSPELRKALTDWLEWAESGGPEGDPFSRAFGLCTNIDAVAGDNVLCEMREMLWDDLGDDDTPFGADDYFRRGKNSTQHECPRRLAWVRKVLEIDA